MPRCICVKWGTKVTLQLFICDLRKEKVRRVSVGWSHWAICYNSSFNPRFQKYGIKNRTDLACNVRRSSPFLEDSFLRKLWKFFIGQRCPAFDNYRSFWMFSLLLLYVSPRPLGFTASWNVIFCFVSHAPFFLGFLVPKIWEFWIFACPETWNTHSSDKPNLM